jgi:hypothetical protein
MGLKNIESRSQRLQGMLLRLRDRVPEELEKRKVHLVKLLNHFEESQDSPSPLFRDELRLINEEIDRRHAKETG